MNKKNSKHNIEIPKWHRINNKHYYQIQILRKELLVANGNKKFNFNQTMPSRCVIEGFVSFVKFIVAKIIFV
jgi:hypothetical protein